MAQFFYLIFSLDKGEGLMPHPRKMIRWVISHGI